MMGQKLLKVAEDCAQEGRADIFVGAQGHP